MVLVAVNDPLLYYTNISNNITVNSLIFARDLFGEIRDHLQITNMNTRKQIHDLSKTWANCKY